MYVVVQFEVFGCIRFGVALEIHAVTFRVPATIRTVTEDLVYTWSVRAHYLNVAGWQFICAATVPVKIVQSRNFCFAGKTLPNCTSVTKIGLADTVRPGNSPRLRYGFGAGMSVGRAVDECR